MSGSYRSGLEDLPHNDAGSVDGDGGSIASFASIASVADPDSLDYERRKVPPAEVDDASRRYRIGPELGAGSMGRVSRVRDLRLLRDVAWKHGDGRILREARILAQLEHPGIVPIYDMGFDHDDRPFFAMRVVSGRSLSQVLRETPLEQRASLLRPLLQAAEAVAFAHHRGVVHRDLKPANVMMGAFGEIQVVDWGLARVLDDAAVPIPAEVRDALAGSEAGRVGTPGYMSPEQEAGSPADRRSDVYALGRMLGDVLGVAAQRQAIAPELLAIVTRSTEPDPPRRYPDAAAFAADLARYLDGGRVQAHTYGPRELLRRFVRAYRVPLVIAAMGLVVTGVLLSRYIADIGEQRERAEGAETEVRAALARSDRFLSRALVGEARRLADEGVRAEAELLAAHALTLNEDPEARGILSSFAGAPALEVLSRAPLPCREAQVDARAGLVLCTRFDGVALWRPGPAGLERAWELCFPVQAARLVDGGVVLANVLEVAVIDLDGHERARAPPPVNPSRRTVADGSLAVLEGNGISILADARSGFVQGVAPCDGALHSALVPRQDIDSGPRLGAALCKDGTLRTDRGSVPTPLVAPGREGVRMAPAGEERFVVGTNKGEVLILDAQGRIGASAFLVDGMVRLLEPSPDGRLLLVAGEGDPIEVVTLPDLAAIASLPRRAKGAVWDRDRHGELVSTGAWLERWRLVDAAPQRPLHGAYALPLEDGVVALDVDPHEPLRLAAAVGPDVAVLRPDGLTRASPGFVTVKGASLWGHTLTAAGAMSPGVLRLDTDTLAPREALPPLAVRRLVTLVDGRPLVATYAELRRLDGDRYETIEDHACLDLSAAPNRRFALALREADHALLRISSADAAPVVVGFDPQAEAVAIGSDGTRLFTARPGEVAAWDDLGHLERVHRADDVQLVDVEVSADGRWIAAGARDGAVYLWSSDETEPRAHFRDHHERVPALAFSADSRWLASGSWDRWLKVRDLAVIDAPAASAREAIARRYRLELHEALGGVVLGEGVRPVVDVHADEAR